MDASYVNYFTVLLQRYSLHCFLLSHWHRSNHGGSHILHLLPCMQEHPLVQASPVLLQEQFCLLPDILHLHVICSRRLAGVCAFVIVSGMRSSLSFVYHDPSVIQDLAYFQEHDSTQMLCSLITSDDKVDNQSLVEAFSVSACSGRTWDNIIHLQCLSFWWSCICCKQRLCFCQVCREQLTGNCTGLPSVKM